MAQGLTPEELEILRQLSGGVAPEARRPDYAEPYNARAAQYNTQADALDRQEPVYAQPQSVKERVVSGIQSGIQDFGRLSVPGGSTGQEALRRKQFDDENANRLERVKALRTQAAQQQNLGQNAVQQFDQKEYQQGNLKINQDQESRLRAEEARRVEEAKQPKYTPVQPGQPVMQTAPGQQPTFTNAPGEKTQPQPRDPKTIETAEGVLQYVPETDSWKKVGGLKPSASSSYQTSQGYSQLAPDLKSRVDAVADKVAAGEYTPSNGLSALGGVRGGLGGALTEALSDRRVLPTAVRVANTDIERAKNLLVPVKRLIAEIDQTPDLQQKAVKSVQLEQYIQAIGTQFARARGERGVVTDKDVDRVLGLMPGWKAANFAPGYAQQNLALIEDAFNRDQEALFGKYFSQVPINNKGGTGGGNTDAIRSRLGLPPKGGQ